MQKIVRLRRPIIITAQGPFGTREELVSAVQGDVKALANGDLRVRAKRGWVVRRDAVAEPPAGVEIQVGWGGDDDFDDDEEQRGWNRQPAVRWALSLHRVNLKPAWITIKERNVDALE